QASLEDVAGLHVRDSLLGQVFQLLGVFIGQDGHDGPGGHAVFDGVEPCADLSLDGPAPGTLLRVEAVCFDSCCGGHGVSSPVGIDHDKAGKLWANSRYRDRQDALIAHEDEEYRTGDHQKALKAAPQTELPISDRAREILRAMERGWRGR